MAIRTVVNPTTGDQRSIEVRPGQSILTAADELLVPEGMDAGGFLALVQGKAPAQAAVETTAPPPATVAQPQTAPTAEQAVAAERQRIAAVMAMPEAKGREPYAMRLAASGMTNDQIAAILSEPRQEPAPAQAVETSPFHAAMSGALGRPAVGPDVPAGGAPASIGQVERSPFGVNSETVQAAAGMILGAVPRELRRQ